MRHKELRTKKAAHNQTFAYANSCVCSRRRIAPNGKEKCYLSNRKLTTEEKIEKSKQITEEISKIEKRLKERRDAQKKLDAEIADDLEKAELVTNQAVGKMFRSRMKDALPLDKYGEIIDFMFMHEDCAEFIAEVIKEYKQELEKAKQAETAHKDEAAYSDNGSIPA